MSKGTPHSLPQILLSHVTVDKAIADLVLIQIQAISAVSSKRGK